MFDPEQWIDEHDLTVVRTAPYGKGGRKWVLERCPWNDDHTDTSAYIVQLPNGAVAAGCHHDSCAGNDWHALRDLLEPDWREHGATEDEEETAFYAGDRHSYDEMLASEPSPVEWLAERFVPARPIVAFASGPGEGKTWLGLCLGLSIAAGKPLFDKYATKQTAVLYLDAENPYADMHRRVTALMVGLGLLTDSLPFVYRGDVRIDLRRPENIYRLVELIREERPGVVFIDCQELFEVAIELGEPLSERFRLFRHRWNAGLPLVQEVPDVEGNARVVAESSLEAAGLQPTVQNPVLRTQALAGKPPFVSPLPKVEPRLESPGPDDEPRELGLPALFLGLWYMRDISVREAQAPPGEAGWGQSLFKGVDDHV